MVEVIAIKAVEVRRLLCSRQFDLILVLQGINKEDISNKTSSNHLTNKVAITLATLHNNNLSKVEVVDNGRSLVRRLQSRILC